MTEKKNLNEAPSEYPVDMDTLLKATVKVEGSDLHLAVGVPPLVRSKGKLVALDFPVFKPESLEKLIYSLLNEDKINEFNKSLELDTSYSIDGVARFRCNIMKQRNSIAAVFRVVPYDVPEIDELGMPDKVKDMCHLSRGIVLVTGPTGSGKSTTLAAMINKINNERRLNIVTVEDPIEFLHKHKKSIVKQREVGIDTYSFANALRHVLRHDPDVILIGEMRDLESISIALTAAETGHLVFSTLHTQTAPMTISRIVDVFEDHQRRQVRQQLANSLRGVISQQLLPTADGKGRTAAIELMLDTSAVRNLIRDEKEHQLYSAIQTSRNMGMQTMDQDLARLYLKGEVTKDDIMERCIDSGEIKRLIQKGEIN